MIARFDAEAAAGLLRADAGAARYAGGENRRLLCAGMLALAGEEGAALACLGRLAAHVEMLERCPAAALADAVRLAALSPVLLRGWRAGGGAGGIAPRGAAAGGAGDSWKSRPMSRWRAIMICILRRCCSRRITSNWMSPRAARAWRCWPMR